MGERLPAGSALKLLVPLALLALSACEADIPSLENIRDSKLFDRRIKETPRQKVIRECKQETERFRVPCLYCHTTDKVDDIKSPQALHFNNTGERAQIMRRSPAFGLTQDCAACHQTKFRLTRSAEKTFGPGGEKHDQAQKELAPIK